MREENVDVNEDVAVEPSVDSENEYNEVETPPPGEGVTSPSEPVGETEYTSISDEDFAGLSNDEKSAYVSRASQRLRELESKATEKTEEIRRRAAELEALNKKPEMVEQRLNLGYDPDRLPPRGEDFADHDQNLNEREKALVEPILTWIQSQEQAKIESEVQTLVQKSDSEMKQILDEYGPKGKVSPGLFLKHQDTFNQMIAQDKSLALKPQMLFNHIAREELTQIAVRNALAGKQADVNRVINTPSSPTSSGSAPSAPAEGFRTTEEALLASLSE